MSDRFIVSEFINQEKSLADFGRGVRANIRGLWNGSFSLFDFVDSMRATIERGFRRAWAEGAGQCGINMTDLTPDEIKQLELMTNNQFPDCFTFSAAKPMPLERMGGGLPGLLDALR